MRFLLPEDGSTETELEEIELHSINERLLLLKTKIDRLIPHQKTNILGTHEKHIEVLTEGIETLVDAAIKRELTFAAICEVLDTLEKYYTVISKP